ncbi:hypothetical protein BN7_1038 [Wickerhamomyces ciferrii]|uniref:Uncharacterized protein n=1 Tax=Wickerhamomyces ciferrii (strain ATCC 14091 / BCRC 22168 / CBS 111 / JCM 3599 / NBRC 0793 / NRRL Y-1031 F-60-10) TaxID=1206466 RepID=K0KH36_WICCF|nr:uncharacterized protein BN7_1038 [Wickerhamomyces ciferrii]CCH41497.1 hypothetical protein BN7_1038 [Wickerhamomyces ciferrii]
MVMDQTNSADQSQASLDELQVSYSGENSSASQTPNSELITHRDSYSTCSGSISENFRKFMSLSNVKELREQIRDNPDNLYEGNLRDVDNPKLPIYLQDTQTRPSTGGSSVELDENLLNAYEMFDVRKRRKISTTTSLPKYEDGLIMKEVHQFDVEDYDTLRYKNNLVDCFGKLLFIASQTKLLVFRNDIHIDTIDVSPPFTSRRDRAAANWSMLPHTINFIKVSNLQGRDVLSCAIDDGRVLIYDIEDFFIKKTQRKVRFDLKLSSSAWGIDTSGDMIAVSDNSQTVTLFYVKHGQLYYHTSPQINHNIPDISFVESNEEGIAYIACASISGELMTFKFKITVNEGPVPDPTGGYTLSVDTVEVYLHPFYKYDIECFVLNRVIIPEDLWIVQYINDDNFKEVDTIRDLGSKTDIDMELILKKSKALNLSSNHLITSDLGGGAWYEEIKIGSATELPIELQPESDSNIIENNLNKFTDKFSRIKHSYDKISEDQFSAAIPRSKDHDKFLFVATATKIGLYRFNELVCNASSENIFDLPFLREELEFSNRLSLTRVIPELSAVLVVSQSGYISVMRFVKCGGLHSLRHEKIIPKIENAFTEVLVGIGIRQMDDKSFWVYSVYSNGKVSVTELSEHDETDTLCVF